MIGRKLGRYEILAKLGAGGMGEVYRARDSILGRDIALKILPERIRADAERLARFEQEARAASALNHPNVITIYDVGQTEGVPFIAMELVEGQTLRSLLGRRLLVTKRALALAVQAADGLAKAHAAGIVHRDLKPENLMVTPDGVLKILDFGLAKLHEVDSVVSPESPTREFTNPGVVLGTASYMSPEQARGHAVDFRSDQFACGAILYEMATGRRAFQKETPAQTMTAIMESEPEPIQNLNPAVPPPFRWIVERCLKKNPDERYAATLDLARELQNVYERLEEVSSHSSPIGGSPPKKGRGWRGGARAAALIAVLGMVAALAMLWRRERSQTPLPQQKHIAVLPFVNAGGDLASKAFSDGLVETLTSRLTQLERFQDSLWVVPASEVRQASLGSAAAASRLFGATLVISGSVQRSGDLVRLTANLVDPVAVRQLRSISIDSRLDDLVAIQDGLIERVTEMLEFELSGEAKRHIEAGGTKVSTAYESYLEGRGHLQRYQERESLDLAVGAFQQALQRDPDYALAYAGLGETYWRLYNLTKGDEWVDLARRTCARAVELNDLLAPVHVTLGLIDHGRGLYAQAITEFEGAINLDPVSVDAHRGLAATYEATGKLEQAETTYQKAIGLRPDDWSSHSYLGTFYFRHGRYAEAERQFLRVVELTPDNVRGYNNLGGVYQKMGRYDDAIATLNRSLAVKPSANAYTNLGTILFFQGRYKESVPLMEKAIALGNGQQILWGNLADAYRWTPGLAGKAKDAYRQAIRLGEAELKVNAQDALTRAYVASYWAKLGVPGRAIEEADRARRVAPSDIQVAFRCAVAYALAGRRGPALEGLVKALRGGYSIEEARNEPDLQGLRLQAEQAIARQPALK
jgi:serine/threonine-protein kinase